jgi:hypothetical protein
MYRSERRSHILFSDAVIGPDGVTQRMSDLEMTVNLSIPRGINSLKSGNLTYMWLIMVLYEEFHATLIWNAGYLYTVLRCLEEDMKQLDAYP